MEKFLMKNRILTITIIFAIFLGLYFSRNFIYVQFQESKMNREFICPENQTTEKIEEDTDKYAKFYEDNYPNIAFDDFLSRRIQLLISHKCIITLQNLANNSGIELPDQNQVNKLKNTPHGPDNLTLKELLK